MTSIPSNAKARKYLIDTLVRIDLQGLFNDDNNICFANLQIQMNIKRKPGQSTTLATVLLEAGEKFPFKYIRKAFLHSFEMKGSIKLQKKKYTKSSKCKKLIKYGDSKKCSSKDSTWSKYY